MAFPQSLSRQASASAALKSQAIGLGTADLAPAGRPYARTLSPLRLNDDGQEPPRWQAVLRLVGFLLEARDPEAVAHRATAALGLLPQVLWAELGGPDQPTDRAALGITLGAANGGPEPHASAPEPRRLAVRLVDPEDVEAATMVSALLGMIERIYDREADVRRLADEAHCDPLTGLWNRRGFQPMLEQALARAARNGEEVALMICDLDHFKEINDRAGHDVGDQALQAVARAVRAAIRPSDVAARLGGDEIAILLSGADAAGAARVHDRLVVALGQDPLSERLPLTLSVGIADASVVEDPELGGSPRTRLNRAADEALYRAKARGRNRAEVHPRCRNAGVPVTVQDDATRRLAK